MSQELFLGKLGHSVFVYVCVRARVRVRMHAHALVHAFSSHSYETTGI